MALIEIGTSCNDCSRFCAVTIISSSCADAGAENANAHITGKTTDRRRYENIVVLVLAMKLDELDRKAPANAAALERNCEIIVCSFMLPPRDINEPLNTRFGRSID
jgi:hypothetical protein